MAKSKFNFWKTMTLFFAFFGAAFLLWSLVPNARQAYQNKAKNSKIVFVKSSGNQALGSFLVDSQGRTLYAFKSDKNGKSTCSGECAKMWPPFLMLSNGVVANGIMGELGTFERADKTLQVTYMGRPLYLYAKDLKPGDTLGHGVNKLWEVVKP